MQSSKVGQQKYGKKIFLRMVHISKQKCYKHTVSRISNSICT
jgi:hypothetical protein